MSVPKIILLVGSGVCFLLAALGVGGESGRLSGAGGVLLVGAVSLS